VADRWAVAQDSGIVWLVARGGVLESLITKELAMRLPTNRFSLLCLVGLCVTTLAFSAAKLLAADPANPLAQGGNNSAAPAAQGSSLTTEQLGNALSSYNKNTINDNGQVVYSITVPKGKWNLNFIVNLSPNGTVIWMTNGLTAMPDKVSTDALLNVLKKNTDIGPMFFSIAHGSLRMNYPVANCNLTADSLKEKVEAMASTVVDVEPLWNADTLAGNSTQPAQQGASNPLAK